MFPTLPSPAPLCPRLRGVLQCRCLLLAPRAPACWQACLAELAVPPQRFVCIQASIRSRPGLICEMLQIRYIHLLHTITNKTDWFKVYVWEIDAYDENGRWGPPPDPEPQAHTFRQLLGVNGIWGWGVK